MRRITLLAVAAVVMFTAWPSLSFADDAADKLHELFEDDWQFRLKENPQFATQMGDRRYNDKLSVASEAANVRRIKTVRGFLDRLGSVDRDALPRDEQVNYDIYKRLREDEVKEFEFKTYLMPITNRSGFHTDFPQLPNRVPLKTVEDYRNYIARLGGFKHYVQEHIELMTAGIRDGYVLPAVVLEGAEGAIEPHVVDDPKESLLYKPFEELPENFSDADSKRLREDAEAAIRHSVVAGYKAFYDFMTEEYLPAARENIAASSLPNGKLFYEHRVRSYTTLDKTPQEIHELGQSEVKRIRGEMQKIIDEVAFEGSFADFIEFLRTDDQFYVKTPEQLMREVAFVLKKMDGELPGLFKTLPRMPYGIKRVPDYIAPKTTTAYYNRPSGDGTRAGFYFVNTYNLESRPTYEIEALSLHEAVPGHHLQIALMQELENTPKFRRFSGFTAFVEGWALYSERLGLEAGFYTDPYNNFGRLTYEMWRALRLVVDTGMHYLGWERQRAIDFMAANSALTVHNITTEVDRYISWPGQALAYKMGELKIRELRGRAEEILGKDFDVREFHDVVLGSGAVPLGVLEENVDNWIASVKADS
jgi:uncharacterized protein (DUF885 family)